MLNANAKMTYIINDKNSEGITNTLALAIP